MRSSENTFTIRTGTGSTFLPNDKIILVDGVFMPCEDSTTFTTGEQPLVVMETIEPTVVITMPRYTSFCGEGFKATAFVEGLLGRAATYEWLDSADLMKSAVVDNESLFVPQVSHGPVVHTFLHYPDLFCCSHHFSLS